MNTKRMVGIVAVAIAMLFVTTSVAPVMAQDISPVVDGIRKNLADLTAANMVIHAQTDVILEGADGKAVGEAGYVPDNVLAMVDTTHMSSHGLLYILPKMEAAITELDAYKANPEANAGKILAAKGKLDTLCKIAAEVPGTTKFSGLMEWDETDESPHMLVHLFMEDPAITGVSEYSDAAGEMHEAMHGIETASSTMEGNLDTLEDMMAELEAPEAQDISPVVDGIRKNLADLTAANMVIHTQTDVILEGADGKAAGEAGYVPDNVLAMVDTTHMSSHGLLYILPKMEAAITELDAYKANPGANAGKILSAKGKLDTLCKMADEIPGTTKFSGLMEWDETDESPHMLVHLFMEDPAITGVSEYSDAAGEMHEAMHGIETASSTMEGNLDTLEDVIGKLGAAAAAPAAASRPTPTPPGFEAIFAIAGISAVAYLVHRRNR